MSFNNGKTINIDLGQMETMGTRPNTKTSMAFKFEWQRGRGRGRARAVHKTSERKGSAQLRFQSVKIGEEVEKNTEPNIQLNYWIKLDYILRCCFGVGTQQYLFPRSRTKIVAPFISCWLQNKRPIFALILFSARFATSTFGWDESFNFIVSLQI